VSGTVDERAYLSIGEVLALLKEEFPDVTISKIRFLESQGLLDPERTPSGYRKFYDTDVERLRWILRQQREHFLPLKVIKGRLRGAGAATADEAPEAAVVEEAAVAEAVAPQETAVAIEPDAEDVAEPDLPVPGRGRAAQPASPPPPAAAAPRPAPAPAPPVVTEAAPLSLSSNGVSMTLGELAAASGLEDDDLRELERYGLLAGGPPPASTTTKRP
jgi:DNA-binding transcriptional MerR regulator